MPHRRGPPGASAPPPAGWTFLTNHAHVLFVIASDHRARHRDVAAHVGLTERAVIRIVKDLVEGGYLRRQRVGRRNAYRLDAAKPLRHPIERHRTVEDLIGLMLDAGADERPTPSEGPRRAPRRRSP